MHPFKSLILFTCIVLIQPHVVDAEKKDYWDNIADVIIMYDLYDIHTPDRSEMKDLKEFFKEMAINLNVSREGNRTSIFKVSHKSSDVILSLSMGVSVDLVVANVEAGVTSADLIRLENRTNYKEVIEAVKKLSPTDDRTHIPNVFIYIATQLNASMSEPMKRVVFDGRPHIVMIMPSYENSSASTSSRTGIATAWIGTSPENHMPGYSPKHACDTVIKFLGALLDNCSSLRNGPYGCEYNTNKKCVGYYSYSKTGGISDEEMCVSGNETINNCDPKLCDDKCKDVKKFTDGPCNVTCGEGQTVRKPKDPDDPDTGTCPHIMVSCTGKPCPTTAPMTTSTSPTTTTTTSTTTKLTTTPAGLSTEMIAVIAGVSGGCLLVIITIAAICYKKKRSARRARSRHLADRLSYSQSQASTTERSDIQAGNGYGGRHGPGGPGRRPSVPPRYPPGRASRTPGGRRAPPGRYNAPRMPPRGGHARRPY